MSLLKQKAKRFLYEKIKNQYVILHSVEIERVIELLLPADEELQIAALLHDILEDSNVTYDELGIKFGWSIANLVNEVTKTGYNIFPNLKTQRGVILKFADRLTNLTHMEKFDEERKAEYIEKSRFWKYE